MSGCWATKKAVSYSQCIRSTYLGCGPAAASSFDQANTKLFQNALAANPLMHGAMLTPIILGTDKMTVSVMTGHQQYHPVYMSLGNIHNEMRQVHHDVVIPIAFLAIPKHMSSSQSSISCPALHISSSELGAKRRQTNIAYSSSSFTMLHSPRS